MTSSGGSAGAERCPESGAEGEAVEVEAAEGAAAESGRDETDGDRLRGILAHDAVSVELVSALAGDRPRTAIEDVVLTEIQDRRGDRFFSDVLYAITHHHFAPVVARVLWEDILRHKATMSRLLGRNAPVIVAALDYLVGPESDLRSPTLVGEGHIAEIVSRSMRDGQTGLFNHTSFYEMLDLELRRCIRHGTVVSLILVDVDRFKDLNDACGHLEGDRVLRELAVRIARAVREADICCRYGGDELAVILPMADAQEAGQVAERIRAAAKTVDAGRPITVSAGVAECRAAAPARTLVESADRALYEAKTQGRDRVIVAGEEPAVP